LSNGQVFLQKTEGLFQYYLDVGAYTIPTLAPYFSTATTVGDFYGPVPIAWAKIAPTDNFYIQGGKLPTLIGGAAIGAAAAGGHGAALGAAVGGAVGALGGLITTPPRYRY
jgi:hypothetical protein